MQIPIPCLPAGSDDYMAWTVFSDKILKFIIKDMIGSTKTLKNYFLNDLLTANNNDVDDARQNFLEKCRKMEPLEKLWASIPYYQLTKKLKIQTRGCVFSNK
jgi:hypothetical protein